MNLADPRGACFRGKDHPPEFGTQLRSLMLNLKSRSPRRSNVFLDCARRGTLLVCCFAALTSVVRAGNALDDYISAPDSAFQWNLASTIDGDGYTIYRLNLTSQRWRSPSEVNRTTWSHALTIYKPDNVQHDSAMLLINGGNNGSPDRSLEAYGGGLAAATGSVLVDLQMVPNQPLRFAGETQSRTEDALVAYSWKKFLETGDPTWPVNLPMTKSAVRAMDAVQAFLGSNTGGRVNINDFIVTGGSKRGNAAWLTAAADTRVSSVIPIVYDALNTEAVFEHTYDVLGFWPEAVHDYVDAGVMDYMGTPELTALMDIVDPYAYKDRLTMPKYSIASAGDQFFVPDASRFYFDGLEGPKYLNYLPNTGHQLSTDPTVILQAFSLYTAILNDVPMPEFDWTISEDGTITVHAETAPDRVLLWQATNPNARDFRFDKIGAAYTSLELVDQGDGTYIARPDRPLTGWTSFFAQLQFSAPFGDGALPLTFTTEVSIIGVPEPSTWAMAAFGGLALVGIGWRKARRG